MTINVPSWFTEHSLTPFPLVKSFGFDSFIIDASFTQFDNFVPTLESILLSDDQVILSILFDIGSISVSIPITDLENSLHSEKIHYESRYLGVISFGAAGVQKLLENLGNGVPKIINTKFHSCTVRSIPSKCGVFGLNGLYGPIDITSDATIEYIVSGNDIEFNAYKIPDASSEPYLKTLNLVAPLDNSVFIESNDIIKVIGEGATVTISMIGNDLRNKPESIIVTSDDNL